MTSTSKTQDHAASIFAGAAAGICSTCAVNPLDTLRIRLAASREATGTQHKSLKSHIRGLFSDGVGQGYRKGLLINLLASTPSNAVYLSSYRFLNEELTSFGLNHHMIPIISAGSAVTVTNTTLAPLFILRTRIQIDPSKSVLGYTKHIFANEGLKGFYRGTITNIAGRIVEEATFWYVFEMLKRVTSEGQMIQKKVDIPVVPKTATTGGEISPLPITSERKHVGSDGLVAFIRASAGVLGLSSMAKLFATSIAYPYNVVIVHLREVDKASGVHKHVNVIPTIRHIHRCDGIAGFYKGLSPHVIRSMVSKATQIYSFELFMSLYLCW
eukprot:Tbor_TRINITY_DN3123_c0_g1::TRINITY_DN3123_c0_g1_i1::g.14698::m.14698/K15116/SLC25A33_36, RIM2; solute carrier family 25, member 33/36